MRMVWKAEVPSFEELEPNETGAEVNSERIGSSWVVKTIAPIGDQSDPVLGKSCVDT
jgi:hypothetical protein